MRPHPLQCHAPKLSYHGRGSVFNAFGDETPGPRNFDGFHTCGFPWGEVMDTSVDVASVDSYRMSMLLSREGLICGPSSGQALQGTLDYIGKLKEVGALAQLADPTTGEVSCVFTMSDLPYQYLPQYFKKLGEGEFPDIQNKVCIQIATRVNISTIDILDSTGVRPVQARQPLDPRPIPSSRDAGTRAIQNNNKNNNQVRPFPPRRLPPGSHQLVVVVFLLPPTSNQRPATSPLLSIHPPIPPQLSAHLCLPKSP